MDSTYDACSTPNRDNGTALSYLTAGAFALPHEGLRTYLFWQNGQFGNEKLELLTFVLWILVDGQLIRHRRHHFKWAVCLHYFLYL